jgi:uncharacterized protein
MGPMSTTSGISQTTTAIRAAISLVKQKASADTIQLRCHVRPGASKSREGVVAITDEAIQLCVSAPAQDGKANKAVIQVLGDVSRRQFS